MTLHVWLLLDTSASMTGAPLEALKQAMHLLCGTFISRSKQPVKVGVISYESAAQEITPLGDVQGFEMPKLEAGGASNLGKAFRLVSEKLSEADSSLIYIFTDGEPTDDWDVIITTLKKKVKKFFVVACGPNANSATLEAKVDRVFKVRELTPDLLFETFRQYS
jgi:uncharacterized protein YegL